MLELLKTLCELDAPSGYEDAVRRFILSHLPDGVQTTVDALGNLIVFKKGAATPKKKLLLDAHMDEVGFLITSVTEDGFFRFAPLGGILPAVVFGRRVRLNGHVGVIGGVPVHHLSEEQRHKPFSMDSLLIDVGACDREEAEQIARPGDFACFDTPFTRFGDGMLLSKALDDRAGCAVLLDLLGHDLPYDIWVSFSVQEETGGGAGCAAYTVAPDLAIVLETTTASDLAGVDPADTVCELGKGATVSFIDRHTVYDRALYEQVLRTAGERGISVQSKRACAGGNNAGSIHRAGAGVRCAAVSVPSRYLHSGSCVICEADLIAVRDLTLALIETLGAS